MDVHWLFPGGLTLLLSVAGAADGGTGTRLSSGADQGVYGIPCPAWNDYLYMHLHTALPNLQAQPCQNTSWSKWPFALTSLQHQLWGNAFLPQAT